MNVLIFGFGLHGGGVGVTNYFIKRGDKVTITDLKSEMELKNSLNKLIDTKNIKLTLGKHDYKDIEESDLIIKNPAIPPNSPYIKYAEKLSVPVDTDVGVFLDIVKKKTNNIVAITGTRGKSTITALIYEVLKRKYRNVLMAGNITISVFDIIEEIKENSWIVLELSSFQLGGIRKKKFSPKYALITNFFNDHLNYYKDRNHYFDDKKVIYEFQKPNDVLVLNRENIVYDIVKPNKGVKVYSFGINQDFQGYGSYLDKDIIWFKDEVGTKKIINRNLIRLKGVHNLLNVIASVTMTAKLGVDILKIEEAITNFKGLEHRLEYLGNIKGVDVYNDSASTTSEALISALQTFENRKITLIMGGTDKALPLRKLVEELNRNKNIRNLILLKGSGTEKLINKGLKQAYDIFDNLKDAVNMAFKVTKGDSVLLFSPAFASFEMFLNEFDRGNKFKELVNSLL